MNKILLTLLLILVLVVGYMNFPTQTWHFLKTNLDSQGILSNFLGGLGVVVLLFFSKEVFRPKRNLTGEWEIENRVVRSSYKPYKGLRVIWKFHMLQNGDRLSGSGEKIKEIRVDNTELEYNPPERDSVELEGYLEKNYLRRSRIFINVIQVGKLRRSRATYILRWKSWKGDNGLVGTFITTAGDSSGSTIFSRHTQDV